MAYESSAARAAIGMAWEASSAK